ncbi:MAG: DUF5009 domain-containing protein [Methanothrix sp.]|nr:MAG: DUF5009 domain-containing protein [Methanothrix sp.]
MNIDRISSLDAFRGLAMVLVLLSSNQGDWTYVIGPLSHSEWFGCSLVDLGFPFFLFIIGVAVPLSIAGRMGKGESREQIFFHALKRAAILASLGVLLMAMHYFIFMDFFRFYGVLQRIALVYLALVIIFLSSPRSLVHASIAAILLISYGLLLLASSYYSSPHEAIMALFPITPEKFNNPADSLDTWIFGNLLYEYNKNLHMGHDPEGLLTTIPSVSTGLIGVLCGTLLTSPRLSLEKKSIYLALAGSVLVFLGIISQCIIPFSKNLWTPSFVIYTAGWAILVLLLLHWMIDQKGFQRFFVLPIALGQNSILIYFMSACLAYLTAAVRWIGPDGNNETLKHWLFSILVRSWAEPLFGPYVASSLWSCLYLAIFALLALWLVKKKIIIKI